MMRKHSGAKSLLFEMSLGMTNHNIDVHSVQGLALKHLALLQSKKVILFFFFVFLWHFFFKCILLIMLLQLFQYFYYPLSPSTLHLSPPPGSCPRVVHVSSLASLVPMWFLTSLCPFYAYQLCLIPCIKKVILNTVIYYNTLNPFSSKVEIRIHKCPRTTFG